MESPTCPARKPCLQSTKMTTIHLWRLAYVFIYIQWAYCTQQDPYMSYSDCFKRGSEAYLNDRWHDCVVDMRNALDDYKFYRHTVIHCRSSCKEETGKLPDLPELPDMPDDIDDLKFYTKALRTTLCIMKCKKNRLADRQEQFVPKYIEEAFESRLPYDYLQLCYHKIGQHQQAASAAYTYLAFNPEHEVMKHNLQFYTSHPSVDGGKIKNLETRTFQELYLMGNEAYNKKQYHEVTHYFEAALEEYYRAEDDCRVLCEGSFDQNGYPEFTLSIANHFTYVMKCKQKCADKLSFMYGEKYDNYLPSHYHYLQYAYFQVGEVRKACEAVGTYLQFHPNDKTMEHNRLFYSSQENISEDDFKPSQEALRYWKRDQYEKKLLKFIRDNYKFGSDVAKQVEKEKKAEAVSPSKTPVILSLIGSDRTTPAKPIPDEAPERQLGETEEEQKRRLKKRAVDILKWSTEQGIQVTMGEKELNGTRRFVADGFAQKQQCQDLMDLAKMAAVHGDGYNGKKSPHTEYETFEGLTVGRAAVLAKLGFVDLDVAQLFLSVSEKGRDFVEKYFRLTKELHFSYTHLVCRTAMHDPSTPRTDLSHPIHADNCIVQSNGDCLKERPAYTWRDYSAIIYLNDDFNGGEFIFAKSKAAIQAHVKPKCGRLVGFSAGAENLHGVKAVTKGRRCALAMWYTLDYHHREKDRELALQVLDQVRKEQDTASVLKFKSQPRAGLSEESCAQCKTLEKSAVEAVLNAKGESSPRETESDAPEFVTNDPSSLTKDEATSKNAVRSSDSAEKHSQLDTDDEVMNQYTVEDFHGYDDIDQQHSHKDL